jgi:hypothetical protein
MSVEESREIGRRFVQEVINDKNLAAADELVRRAMGGDPDREAKI